MNKATIFICLLLITGCSDIIDLKARMGKVEGRMSMTENTMVRGKKIDGMLDELKRVTDKSGELSTTITELKKSSESFAKATEKLDNILGKIDNSEGTMGKLISDTTLYGNMNNLVNEMRAFVNDIKDNPVKYMKAYRKSKK